MKIYIAMNSTVLAASIRQVFEHPGKQDFVKTATEADVVIFDSFDLVKETFRDDIPYGYIPNMAGASYQKDLPANVRTMEHGNMLTSIMALFQTALKPKPK